MIKMNEEEVKELIAIYEDKERYNTAKRLGKMFHSYKQLQKENQQLRNALEKLKDSAGWREILELSGIIQERDKLQQENADLNEKIILLKASEPMLELEKYYGERDKYKEVIDKATKFYLQELAKREQLQTPQNMPWESVEMFNILEGNK